MCLMQVVSNVSCIRVLQLNISINVFLIDSTRVIVTGIVYAKGLQCVSSIVLESLSLEECMLRHWSYKEYCKFLLVQFYSLLFLSTVSLVLWQTLRKEISLPQT